MGILCAVAVLALCVFPAGSTASEFANLRRIAQKWLIRTGLMTSNRPVREQPDADPSGPVGAAHRALRIWPIGDSITEGFAGYSSYRYWLWRMLAEAKIDADFVGTKTGVFGGSPLHSDFTQNHNSYVGYRADDVVPLIRAAAERVNFDAALVHLGTNDIGHGETPEEIIGDLRRLLTVLRERNPRSVIFLAQVIPTAGPRNPVLALNQAIGIFAQAESTDISPVIAVDQYTGFDPSLLLYDGLHPTEAGEKKIATAWFKAIAGHYKQ